VLYELFDLAENVTEISTVTNVTIKTVSFNKKNPSGADFPPVQTGPEAHPASCTMGAGSFPGLKYGRGVLLTTHPF
jgi:hypothetical protein